MYITRVHVLVYMPFASTRLTWLNYDPSDKDGGPRNEFNAAVFTQSICWNGSFKIHTFAAITPGWLIVKIMPGILPEIYRVNLDMIALSHCVFDSYGDNVIFHPKLTYRCSFPCERFPEVSLQFFINRIISWKTFTQFTDSFMRH